MPIYQYVCRGCGRRFEQLVRGAARPACPACGGGDLERLLSVFAVGRAEEGRRGEGGLAAGREESGAPAGACGRCGDPRGPGACALP